MRQLTVPALSSALLLFSLPSLSAQTAGSKHSLSLDEAIARALEVNEVIIIETHAAEIAASRETAARGAYDPLFSLDASWQESTEPVNSAFSGAPEGALAPTNEAVATGVTLDRLTPAGGRFQVRARSGRVDSDGSFSLLAPAYDSNLGVEFRQPLLRNRAIDTARLGVRVANVDRSRAAASLEREVRDTVASVEQAYWALAAAQRDVDVQREAVELAEEQLVETRLRIEGGGAPEAEVAQPQAELERRRGDLLQARETAARAENRLKLLILGETDSALWAQGLVPVDDIEIEATPVDVAQALSLALANRSEVHAAEYLVERRGIEARFADNRTQPTLDAFISYDRFGLAGDLNPAGGSIPGLPDEVPGELVGDLGDAWSAIGGGDFNDTRIGLLLEFPLKDRLAEANAEIAASTRLQAEASLARVRKAVRAEILDAAAVLETAGARIEAADAGLQAAEVQLESEQERFAVGLSTNFLVLTRQNDLASARLNLTRVLADYRAALVEMDRATGNLLTNYGIQIDDKAESLPNE